MFSAPPVCVVEAYGAKICFKKGLVKSLARL